MPIRSRYLYSFAAPLLIVAVLQVSGCTKKVAPPPPPGGAYISTSAGAHFDQSVQLVGDIEEGGNIARFNLREAHRPTHSPNHVYIAAAQDGYIWSEDGGESWQQVRTPLTAIADVVRLENGVIVAAGVDVQGQGLVMRSSDGGRSWESTLTIPVEESGGNFQLLGNGELPMSQVVSIELDPFDPNRVYVGSNLGTIFVGEQSAKVWRSVHTLQSGTFTPDRTGLGVLDIIPSPHTSGELLIITSANTLRRIRPDGSQQEVKILKDLRQTGILKTSGTKKIFDVTYLKDFPDALFVGVEDGAIISRDGGATFEQLPIPIEQFKEFNSASVAASPTNTARLLVGINNVVFRSEDGGKTWFTFPLNAPGYGITSILIDPTSASRVLVVTTPFPS